MKLAELVIALTYRLQKELPGSRAHEPMRAVAVGDTIPNFKHKLPPKKGSVLILLYDHHGQIKFPLIKRQEYLGAHSGQISLPGGKTEPGEDAYQAALREGEEEIGVNRSQMKIVGQLSEFFVIPSNFIVTPVVAFLDQTPVFIPDPYEVAKIISGSIHELVSDDAILKKEIIAAGTYRMQAPHFEIEGEVVWGATAMMLNEFRMVLKEILSN
jgi:8-oxo-dGTP pyrophosphatase MutT (NUDIX family)